MQATKHRKSIGFVAEEGKKALEPVLSREKDSDAAKVEYQARRRGTELWGSKEEGEATPVHVTSDMPLPIPESSTLAGRPAIKWVKGELIGKGIYNKVFLATNVTTGEMLAVKQAQMPKTIDGQLDTRQMRIVDSLKAERMIMESLDHPNVVQCLGFEQTMEFFSVFLEYVPGGSIGSYLRKHGNFAEDTIKSFTGMIVAGLAYLHENSIIHRDIKADNILVDHGGICKISNFGMAKHSLNVYYSTAMVMAQGSIFWMAPEMLRNGKGKKTYSAKVDIWSLGCVLFEMFTGRGPWEHDDYVSMMFRAEREKMAPPVPDDVTLSPDADDFRLQCFCQDPDDRPTARALLFHRWLVIPTNWKFGGFGSPNPSFLPLVESAGITQNSNIEIDSSITDYIPSIAPAGGDVGEEITFDSTEPFDTRGNFCDLFIGTHKTAGKVALKRLRYRGGDEENIATITRQFRRESDIWMTLRHSRILQCLGMFTRERSLYLVSPFMKNGSLFDWLRRGEPLGLERLRLIHELADALVYLHARGIVHGDVKANNVLLSGGMHVQLCDFGLTKLAESATTTSLKGAGTVRWQGPELWEDNPKSFKSDVYAFAMTIVEVLTSQIPFATITNDYTVIKAVSMRDQRPAQLPQTSQDGRSYSNSWLVAERCWNADPDQRISMAEAVELFSLCTEHH